MPKTSLPMPSASAWMSDGVSRGNRISTARDRTREQHPQAGRERNEETMLIAKPGCDAGADLAATAKSS
jgi:hypothetical protein